MGSPAESVCNAGRLIVELDCSLPPERVLLALRDEPWPFALTGRWAGGGAIVGCAPRTLLAPGDDPFARLEDLPEARGDAVVGGGWFGWLGYGLGALVEDLPERPERPVPLPDAHLAFYDHVLRMDADGKWFFEALDGPDEAAGGVAAAGVAAAGEAAGGEAAGGEAAGGVAAGGVAAGGEAAGGEAAGGVAAAGEAAGGEAAGGEAAGGEAADDPRLARLRALLAAAPPVHAPAPTAFSWRAPGGAAHMDAVADCVERIAAGEIFQANLCLRLEAEHDGSVADLFAHAMPRLEPAYAACFVTPWGGIASLSPELFLRREGRNVTTGPIKGTAPRDPAALARSEKDRAEHVMIVDLMRNDLGRVASYGTVEAPVAPEAQPHSGVWHLVSEVRAQLAPGNGDAALLRATFPPGSVTGAPKVQAMKVIAALEASGREVYTGAIGYASPHAGLELNVAIRTFEARGNHLWLGVGGGIVADSDPEAELEECRVKARPLLDAIGGWIRPDPSLGVFETLLVEDGVAVNKEAHLARLARSVERLYGERLEPVTLPRSPGAVRITYVPGRPLSVQWRPLTRRPVPVVLTPYVVPGGLGEHKWNDRRYLQQLSKDGTTPLLVDTDGTLLEAAWAAVLIRRDGVLYTPREDGRILPSTSRPDAIQADLNLEPGDELLLSSSLAGVVPAVLADASPAPLAGTPRTPSRTAP